MKAAVYSASRNLYEDMVPSIKSLLLNSDVQKIYLLIEDDVFPYELPQECQCINISNQTYFKQGGPNWNSQFTYLSLMRASLALMFPDLDRILSLDCDVIVDRNISSLWDIDLTDCYFAASEQPKRSEDYKREKGKDDYYYSNTGVCLYNLKMLRQTGKVNEVINELNSKYYFNLQQDVFNFFCQDHIYKLGPEYNSTIYSYHAEEPKIIHYAGYKKWNHFKGILKYKDIPWEYIKTRRIKTAVYCGTREIYQDMIPSIKSLLINSNVQKIYLLIEDDQFPHELPKECECINVSNQTYFPKTGANYKARCTWMVLMRAALSKVLPDRDIVLSLDADAIVDKDISELWNLDLTNYYYAGVKEFARSKIGNGYNCPIYLNGGVLLCNLKRLREKKKDDQIIERLNKNYYAAAEQDAINFSCQGNLLNLPVYYNENEFTGETNEPKIVHYAGIKEWNNFDLVKEYRNIDWKDIRK